MQCYFCNLILIQFKRSVVSDSATPWIAARQASLSITNSRGSFKFTSIESVMPSSHLILCRPLLLLPPIPPCIRVFSNESTLRMRWPKYWSFSFSIIPSKEIPGQISIRMDWLDLLAVQGTLKSLLQHHSSKASILRRSTFLLTYVSRYLFLLTCSQILSECENHVSGSAGSSQGWRRCPVASLFFQNITVISSHRLHSHSPSILPSLCCLSL